MTGNPWIDLAVIAIGLSLLISALFGGDDAGERGA
jgi:hypothetical protein